MDIKYINNKYQFIYRTSCVIFDKTKSKILLFKVKGKKIYLLPGGKVKEGEDSKTAIKREIQEELGYSNLKYTFLAISEEFIRRQTYNQQINIIYYTIVDKETEQLSFIGKEGNWCYFKWIDIKDLNKYNLFPKEITKAIKDINNIYHFINK